MLCTFPCCLFYFEGVQKRLLFLIDFFQTNVKPDLHLVRHSAKTLCASFQLQIALHFLWALRKTINQTSISGAVRLSVVSTMAGRRCSAHTACWCNLGALMHFLCNVTWDARRRRQRRASASYLGRCDNGAFLGECMRLAWWRWCWEFS